MSEPQPTEPQPTEQGSTEQGPTEHPDRVDTRAELLPEEDRAGSDDPAEQAEAILAESDERTDDPEGTRAASTQTPGGEPGGVPREPGGSGGVTETTGAGGGTGA